MSERAGRPVSREELFAAAWPGVVVGDEALTQTINKLRKAFGDASRSPSYIETIAKRGYRLIADVRPWQAEDATSGPAPARNEQRVVDAASSPPAARSHWRAIALIALTATAIAVTAGYFAIRMKSDIIYETEYNGVLTQEKYCVRPGLYCGLILLTSIENGELLAFINDGYLQHMRVGADGGIGVKYLANPDAEVVGMLGAGGMARTHMEAFMRVRKIEKLQVYSPTRENRERFGREMAAKYNIEVKVCNRPEDVYKGAHILAAVTDSAVEVTDGSFLEKGTHMVVVGGTGKPDAESLRRVDVYLRFGDTPAPVTCTPFSIASMRLS